MKKYLSSMLLVSSLLTGAFVSSISNPNGQENPIKWSLAVEPARQSFQPGNQFTAELSAQIEEGWHLYALDEVPNGPRPTRISVPDEQPFELAGEIKQPAPIVKHDENFGVETQYFESQAAFKLPIKISLMTRPGAVNLMVQARYQVCNEQLCLPPKTVKVETLVVIK